jgi:hypothetical protein
VLPIISQCGRLYSISRLNRIRASQQEEIEMSKKATRPATAKSSSTATPTNESNANKLLSTLETGRKLTANLVAAVTASKPQR